MKTKWEDAGGALIHHGIQLQKGINVEDHLRRAKLRIIELEILSKQDVAKKDLSKPMTLIDACMIVYNKHPYGDDIIPGIEFAAQFNLLRGKYKAYPDSVFKKMREIRNGEHYFLNVSWECVDAHSKSLYKKPDRRKKKRILEEK